MIKNNKEKIKLGLFLLLAALSVALCFQPQNGKGLEEVNHHGRLQTIKDKEIVINYYIWENEKSYIEPVIEAYQALNPGIYINLHSVEADLYDNNLENILSQEGQVDLVGVRETSHLVGLVEKGYLLDVTSYISEYELEIEAYGNMFNEIRIDGRYYGIPARSTCWILLYNKDIFDAAGLAYPEKMTWKEYGELALYLTKENEEIYGGYWPPWCFNFSALQDSSYLIDDDLEKTKESLNLLNEFYNIDGSHVSYDNTIQQPLPLAEVFLQGNIAMMPQGEWIINMLLEREKHGSYHVNWGIAPMPVNSKREGQTTWGQYQFACIASGTQHPNEVFDFLSFLCGEEAATIYAKNGMIHAYSSDEVWNIYGETIGEDIAEVLYNAKRKQEQLAIPNYHEVLDLFEQYAHKYLSGELSLDKTMEEFDLLRHEIYRK